MKSRWMNLSLQEKRMVSGGIFFSVLLLGYLLLWTPLANSVLALRQDAQQNETLYTWMVEADQRIQSMTQHLQPKPRAAGESIFTLVQTAIQQSVFAQKLTNLKQAEQDSVQVNFKEVPFDDLATWLIQLWQQQGLQVSQMMITRASEAGAVTATFILH